MEQNKYEKTPLVDLVNNLAFREQEIGLKILYINRCIEEINKEIAEYEEMRKEVVSRFPIPEVEETYEEKTLIKKVNNYGDKKR